MRRAAGWRSPEQEQARQASDPQRPRRDVQPVERDGEPSRGGLRRMAGGGRDHERRRRGGGDADPGEDLGNRAVLPLGAVDPERDPGCEDEEREADLQVDIAPPERGRPPERHERPHVGKPTQRVDRGRLFEVGRHRDQSEDRGDGEGDRDRAKARSGAPDTRPRDRQPHREQSDRGHHGQEHEPLEDHELWRRRRARYVRDHELRSGPRVGADREREGALDRVAVDRDRPPVDEVPALGQVRLERDDQGVRVGSRPTWRCSRYLLAVLVGDGDDREAGLDGLVEGQGNVGGRGVEDGARLRERLGQVRMRRRRHGRHERDQRDERDQDSPPPACHASCRFPPPANRATAPRMSPRTPTMSATIVSSDVLPPPSEAFASIVGAGFSADSEPFQSTIVPSE